MVEVPGFGDRVFGGDEARLGPSRNPLSSIIGAYDNNQEQLALYCLNIAHDSDISERI
jgi:hypothetical protein